MRFGTLFSGIGGGGSCSAAARVGVCLSSGERPGFPRKSCSTTIRRSSTMGTSRRSRSSRQLTLSLPEAHVRDSASRDDTMDWMIRVLDSPSLSDLSSLLHDPGGCYGRMSPVCSDPTAEPTSGRSSNRWKKWGIRAHGESWIRNGSEAARSHGLSRKDESVSSLFSILIPDPPQRFFLTPRACAGIHTRFERAGKLSKLPETLPGDTGRSDDGAFAVVDDQYIHPKSGSR